MKQHITIHLRSLITVLVLCMTITSQAQTLDFRFKSEAAEKLYMVAMHKAISHEGWILADSLRHMSENCGDTYGELMALSIMTRYQFEHAKNISELKRTVKPMMDKGLKSGYINFYYSGLFYLLTYKINRRDFDGVIDYVLQQLDFAARNRHYYGMAVCHLTLGNIYWMKHRAVEAINEYEQGIDCFKRSPNTYHRSFASAYKMIADSYLMMGKFEELLQTADRTLKIIHQEPVVNGMNGYRAFALFMLNRNQEFTDTYRIFKNNKTDHYEMQPDVEPCLEAMQLICQGKDIQAEQLMARYPDNYYMNFVAIAYYDRRQRYKEMDERMQALNIAMYGTVYTSHLTALHYSRAQIDNQLANIERQDAEHQHKQLKLQQAKLQLQQTDLELNKSKSLEQLAQIDAENNRLANGNQQLLNCQLQDSIANLQKQQYIERQQQDEHSMKLTIAILIVIILCLLAYILLRRNKKLSIELRNTNNELQDHLVQLQKASALAKLSDEKKTKFIQDMSHEIRTPLNAIVGFTQILTQAKETLTNTEKGDIVKEVTENSTLLSALVNNILDLTNIETGRYVMQHNTIDINNLCRNAIDSRKFMKADDVEVVFNSNMTDADTITGDEHRLFQMLTHMLSNAMKNTEHGIITLDCLYSAKDKNVSFIVTDTGCGIPEDKRNEVFKRFKKLDRFKQGVGLGLEICRTIATRMNGSFLLDNQYTGGARFIFTIPIIPSAPDNTEA